METSSSQANAVDGAQKRCRQVQEHLAQALGALSALSSELTPEDVDSGSLRRQTSTAVDQAEDLAFCRGLFDEIISIAAPADSNAIDPGHVIGALEFMKDNGDIHPEVVVDLQNLLSKRIEWVDSLKMEQELLALLRTGTWQDPLYGVRSMTDSEADDVCSKFSARLRVLIRDGQLRLDPVLAESRMSGSSTVHGMLEKLVGKLTTGDYFGEIALLCRKPRQATVKSVGKLAVLVMDREAFTRLCGNLEAILHRNLDQYSTTEITHDPAEEDIAALEALVVDEPAMGSPEPSRARTAKARRGSVFAKAVELEANWAPPEYPKSEAEVSRLQVQLTLNIATCIIRTQRTVILAVKKQTYAAGDKIIEQGADGDYYYILDSGHANVYISRKGLEEKVFEYSTGGAFGELALIHGEPRLATVRATQECVCWALDRDTFRKIMMSSGKQSMNERTKFLGQVELLKSLAPFERFKIAEVMITREFEDGDVVVREGDMGDEFFIIQKGTCHVYKLLPDRPTI